MIVGTFQDGNLAEHSLFSVAILNFIPVTLESPMSKLWHPCMTLRNCVGGRACYRGNSKHTPSELAKKEEQRYLADMRSSKFCTTRRKSGWQSARTLEILGSGCVPFFCDLWSAPKEGGLANLPREVLVSVLHWPGVQARCFPKKKSRVKPLPHNFNNTRLLRIAQKLVKYTQSYLTTRYIATYMLSATSIVTLPKTVLLIWTTHPDHPGYLASTFLHGLKSIDGIDVTDLPRQSSIYADPTCDGSKYWGKGYFIFCRVPVERNEAERDRANIEAKIAARHYDVVVYHFPNEYFLNQTNPLQRYLFWDLVHKHYSVDRILLMNDHDLWIPMTQDPAAKYHSGNGIYVKRETHGCTESIETGGDLPHNSML
eukprot:PhF_6_TR21182/c0_g2_i1/m.30534